MEGEKLGAINVIAASFLWRSPEMQDELGVDRDAKK
jgi:hypothetical protein